MDISSVWWVLTGMAVVAELLTGTIYLLMIALGMAAGAVAAHLGWDLPAQIVVAALVAVLCMSVTRVLRRKRRAASTDPAVQLDIGAQVQVTHWQDDGTAQVQYRGAQWRAVPANTAVAKLPGMYQVVALQGNHLVVQPLNAL